MTDKQPEAFKQPDMLYKHEQGETSKQIFTWHSDEKFKSLQDANNDLLKELEKLYKAYVNLLRGGRDRIVSLGGDCDQVEEMVESDPSLRDTRLAFAKAKGG